MYDKPDKSRHVNAAELEYIQQDDATAAEDSAAADAAKASKQISFLKCFTFRQTWSFIVGKFFTDGVWWFYLFWAPAYFKEQGHGQEWAWP